MKTSMTADVLYIVCLLYTSIREMCDKVIWLERGEMKMCGPTDEVCDAYSGKQEETHE